MIKQLFKTYKTPILFVLICTAMYGSFAYDLERSDFIKLITLFGTLFFLTYQLVKILGNQTSILFFLGLFFRLVFLVAIPNLSQDFYRFIWDGHLVINGISPYSFTVKELVTDSSFLLGITPTEIQLLYEGMGSLNASHYSNYPPLNQLCFAIASFIGGKSILGSVITLRTLIILADIGILYFGMKLLKALELPIKNIFWYFLNPFIIIELTGNLHFEGVMLFFVIAALYFLQQRKWVNAAILLGCSVSLKLLPLLFLPLFFQYFTKKDYSKSLGILKLSLFYSLTLSVFILSFIPFASGAFIDNFTASITLWFQKFEFNASVYYIIRWVGFQTVGWNIIGTAGKVLPLIFICFLLAITFFRKNIPFQSLITALLISSSLYFLLSTTVHPWYIATPLLLSVFTKYRFPIIWSFVVMLSYSAYTLGGFQENLGWVALEYLLVMVYAIWEVFFKHHKRQLIQID